MLNRSFVHLEEIDPWVHRLFTIDLADQLATYK